MAEDVRIKVTLDTQDAQRNLQRLRGEARSAATELDRATGGDGSATGRAPAARPIGSRFQAGGPSGLGGALPGALRGITGAAALQAAQTALQPAFQAAARPGATASDFGAGLTRGTVDLLRNIPIAGQAIGAAFDRTVGTALDVREQAIQATAAATSGLAAAGIQVDQGTLAQINAVQMELALRQVRNEAAARRAAPGVLDSVLALGLE